MIERSKASRRIAATLLCAGLLVSTAACNTVRGLGQDLQSVANAVDEET